MAGTGDSARGTGRALNPLSLRKATIDEARALTLLCLRSKAMWGYDDAFIAACREELTVSEAAIAAGNVIVAEMNGTVAGIAEVSVSGDLASIEKLFVEPAMTRAGAGRLLFSAIEGEACRRGAHMLEVESDPNAETFYLAMGMERTGRTAASGSIAGRKLAIYSKPVSG